MDLNAVFTSTTPYRSATTQTSGEHALFVGVGITPVHGWLVGPEGPDTPLSNAWMTINRQ